MSDEERPIQEAVELLQVGPAQLDLGLRIVREPLGHVLVKPHHVTKVSRFPGQRLVPLVQGVARGIEEGHAARKVGGRPVCDRQR